MSSHDLAGRKRELEEGGAVPAGLSFERLLFNDTYAHRMSAVFARRHAGAAERAVVVASKSPWTEAELRELVEGGQNELAEEHRNDKFSKHSGPARTGVSLTLICPANDVDVLKYTEQPTYVVRETPAIYRDITLPYVQSLPEKQTAWVHAILEGRAENDARVHEDSHFVVVRDSKWDGKDMQAMYVLALFRDTSVRSVRDLRAKHAAPLRNLRDELLVRVHAAYGIPASKVRAYFHYLPSFWVAHVHFNCVTCPAVGGGMAADRAMLLDDVLERLERDPSHFERCGITYSVGAQTPLCAKLVEAGVITPPDVTAPS